jgi:adenine-specific DNA methylase
VGTDAKARGAYYTPAPLAEAICRWAIRSRGDRVLDPAAGDGAFLRAAAALTDVPPAGIELDPAAARAAGAVCDDFFRVERAARYDAVVGNPPFIRYQRFAGKARALEMARRTGAALGGESSAWAPFVAVAAGLVRPGGRLGMVIPREGLFVNYTRPLLDFLVRRFGSVEAVALEPLLFEALEKVAVLLCGPGTGGLRIREAGALSELHTGTEEVRGRPWLWSRVPAGCRGAVEEALAQARPLSEVARVKLGIVTGDKDFFVLAPEQARALGIDRRHLTPVYASPSELGGPPARLLLTAGRLDAPLRRYVRVGRRRGVAARFKCRIRDPWWSIRPGPAPDAFWGYLVSTRPAFCFNPGAAQSTNNVHQIFYRDEPVRLDHPLTELSVELLGRIYGGGVLKIEPGDAPRIRVPRPGRPMRRPDQIHRALAALRARRLAR